MMKGKERTGKEREAKTKKNGGGKNDEPYFKSNHPNAEL